jgi:hypothetical protein
VPFANATWIQSTPTGLLVEAITVPLLPPAAGQHVTAG